MTESLTVQLRRLIGTKRTYQAREPIGAASARYFAEALGDDRQVATPSRTLTDARAPEIVPPTLIFETTQLGGLPVDADGYGGHSWPVKVPSDVRLVRGGHSYIWHRDVHVDDVITSTWRVDDVAEKNDRAGSPMIVLTSSCRYVDGEGDLVAEQTETLIYLQRRL